jgi:hypothetical protein
MRAKSFSANLQLALGLALSAPVLLLSPLSLKARSFPPDACSLLTPVQLERVLGQPFELSDRSLAPTSHPGQPPGRECDYTAQKGATRKVVFIAFVDASAAQARETYDKLTSWMAPKSKLPGLWDAAYVDDNHAIHVLKGKVRYYITIVPFGTATPEREKQLRDLADCVAARI